MTPTPGQLAYEAFAAFWLGYGFGPQTHLPWLALTPEQRGAWDAAAQAVLAQGTLQPEGRTP
jgi:hypothetical protein